MNRHLAEEPIKAIISKRRKVFPGKQKYQKIGKHGKPKQILTV